MFANQLHSDFRAAGVSCGSSFKKRLQHMPTLFTIMYMNSGSENVMSLNFMGKKLRNHTVTPATKQRAWETTTLSRCPEDSIGPSRVARIHQAVSVVEELPGSVPDLREEVQRCRPCTIHNTRLDQDADTGAAEHEASWLKKSRIKWAVFKRRIGANRRCDPAGAMDQESTSSVCGKLRERESEASMNVKFFIPYDSAKLCITQIADDMMTMKSKHLEMVQELEENFMIASRENQERTALRIRTHYQNKLNALKRILDVYQEKVERKNAYWEERIRTLQSVNQRQQEEQRAMLDRSREDTAAWQREKSKMMELFSTRLDLLHSHQASTLQELQMARLEVGKVQEMLKSPQVEEEPEEAHDEKPDTQNCNDAEEPLEGAQARLEVLKESLFRTEREITQLLDGEGEGERKGPDRMRRPVTVTQPACAALLNAVIQKAHCVYIEVSEATLLLDHMAEENRNAFAQVRQNLHHTPNTSPEKGLKEEENIEPQPEELEDGQLDQNVKLQNFEIMQMALDCIRAGSTPSISGLDCKTAYANSYMETVSASGCEDGFRKSEFLTTETVRSVGQQLLLLQAELKQVREDNKKIVENYTAERTMRKKYYNMVEDMKGKIRVFCRIRPMSQAETARGGTSIVYCMDEYSVIVETPRGPREFQLDKIFDTESSQDEVFQDSSRLIQSAIDGFNVCIFAYGQTGSGKTFTMVGDKDLKNPGIIPRTFTKIFEIIQENESKFDFKVSAYMLELYNNRLQDLFVSPAEAFSKRIEIKKDKKGLVFAQGAETKEAASAGELFALYEQGCVNRHIAATKMNMESSRSHLIIGIMVESRNLTNGSVSFGKLTLVDLAGSERAAKTGAKDDQLKEANSINKSLSALGDVISALSMEQAHVPYRNNRLTQAMQDSLGGNAKTLMFLNISPSDSNLEETLTALIYATRVKAITNNAQRNMESKEIAQLKEVILKLKLGQPVEEEEV